MKVFEIFDGPNSSKLEPYLIGVIVIYPLLFVWQGLSFVDMGYFLTGYQQFIVSPEGIGTGLINWSTYAVGYLVTEVAGDLGVVAYKLANVLLGLLTLAISFLMLNSVRRKNSRSLLLLLVFVGMLYVSKISNTWLGYNSLTAFTYIAGAALLYFGLIRATFLLIMLSGLVIGLGIFVRFPNLLGIMLVVAIPLWGWSEKTKASKIIQQCGVFLLGYFLAIIMMIFIMEWFGHLSFYKSGLEAIVGVASDNEHSHNSGKLIKKVFKDNVKAFLLAGGAIATGYVFAHSANLFNYKGRATVFIVGVILCLAVLPIMGMWRWVVTGLCYVILLVTVFRGFRVDNQLMLLSFIAGLVLLLVPMGSASSMRTAIHGSWLAVPLALLILLRTKKIALPRFRLGNSDVHFLLSGNDVRFLSVFAIVVLICFSFATKMICIRGDSANRLAMTHTINHPLLGGVLTTESRAKVVGEVLREMEHHVQPGDGLLAYNAIPTIHYLTRTVPWLGTPWPMAGRTSEVIKLLKEKELSKSKLPVIVRAIGNTTNEEWPLGNRAFYTAYVGDNSGAIRVAFSDFVRRNGYRVVWKNDYFEILKPFPHGLSFDNDKS